MKNSAHQERKNRAPVFLYALSTCGMCRRVKKLLKDLGVEYDYVDVDLYPIDERDSIIKEMRKWNDRSPFPMLIIKNETCIVGDELDEIKKALGK